MLRMARNTTPAPQSKEEPANNAAIAAEMDATNQLAVIERNRQEIQTQAEQEKDELMDLGRRLGQMETAAFVGNISDGILISAYENVKKSKAWKLLRNRSGEIFPNLDAFCQERLGFSAKRLSQIHGNREALGQETFEQAERLGLRQVDYNAIKGLPAPDQELVRRAVEEAQSRDEVLDLLQELAGRHANEKAAFAKQADEHVRRHHQAPGGAAQATCPQRFVPNWDECKLLLSCRASGFAFQCRPLHASIFKNWKNVKFERFERLSQNPMLRSTNSAPWDKLTKLQFWTSWRAGWMT